MSAMPDIEAMVHDPDDIEIFRADAQRLLNAVIADCNECNRLNKGEDTPFSRRVAFRTIFSAIEALAHHARQQAALRHRLGHVVFREADLENLDPDAHIPFRDGVKAALNLLSQARNKPPLDYGGKGWESLLASVRIRDRITHPKKAEDYEVSRKDLEVADLAWRWFTENLAKCISTPDAPWPPR
jgi:hypothetical protein